jgi:hypothetical protein
MLEDKYVQTAKRRDWRPNFNLKQSQQEAEQAVRVATTGRLIARVYIIITIASFYLSYS